MFYVAQWQAHPPTTAGGTGLNPAGSENFDTCIKFIIFEILHLTVHNIAHRMHTGHHSSTC